MNKTLAAAFFAAVVVGAGVCGAETAGQAPDAPASLGTADASTSASTGSELPSFTKPLYAADDTQPAAPAAPAAKKVGGSVSFTVPTKYISRGLILNNSGFIFQPAAELDFDLYDGKGPINSISPYIGVWNDLTDNHKFATHTLRSWYEFDWDAGVSITFLNNWNFNIQYIEFTSPSGAFGTAKNIIPQLSFNDSSLWGANNPLAFSLNPYVAGLIETNGKAGSGAKLGYYLEPGLSPSITLGATGDLPVTISMPIKVGLGFHNFYGGANPSKDELFGYGSAGVQISLPIKAIDATLGGSWSLSAGGYYYYYGSGTHSFNSANVGYTSRNDVIGQISLLCKF